MLLGVGGTTAAARPRPRAAPLKFEIKAVDSFTGKRKSKFFLGEKVLITFTLTNVGRVARTIPELQDTAIPFELKKTNIETRSNGQYHLTQMTQGGTYTLTPELSWLGKHSRAEYTFNPPSRTVTNLNSKLMGVDFRVTQVRVITNVAAADEGGKATASSFLDENDDYLAEYVLDGSESGDDWGRCFCGGWSDGTPGSYPDWVEVSFKGTRTIDRINVFTLPDNYSNHPGERDLNRTFSKYGITDFDVQYWNGVVWKNVPGGTIRGNKKVWRQIDFPTLNTNKIRVVVRNALDGHSRITEIEAFHINDLPLVKILGPSKGTTGSTLQFRTKAVDVDGTIRSYSLYFDDGPDYEWEASGKTAGKGPLLTHTHKYTKAGTYAVTLAVTDDNEEASEAYTTVTITDPPQPPEASAGSGYEGIAGEDVFFEGRASSDPDGRIVRYRWTFGDGTTGTGPNPWHKYAKPGTYKVTIVVTDDAGQTARSTALARITAPPPKPR